MIDNQSLILSWERLLTWFLLVLRNWFSMKIILISLIRSNSLIAKLCVTSILDNLTMFLEGSIFKSIKEVLENSGTAWLKTLLRISQNRLHCFKTSMMKDLSRLKMNWLEACLVQIHCKDALWENNKPQLLRFY